MLETIGLDRLLVNLVPYSRWKCALAVIGLAAFASHAMEAPLRAAETSEAAGLKAEYDRLSSAYATTVPGWRPAPPTSGSLLFVAPDQYTGSEPSGGKFKDARNAYADEK